MTIQSTSPRVDLCIRRAELFSSICRCRDKIRHLELAIKADRDAIDVIEAELAELEAAELPQQVRA